MYNRYTPTPGGQYQRKPVPEPKRPPRPTAGAAVFPRSAACAAAAGTAAVFSPAARSAAPTRCGCRFWRG